MWNCKEHSLIFHLLNLSVESRHKQMKKKNPKNEIEMEYILFSYLPFYLNTYIIHKYFTTLLDLLLVHLPFFLCFMTNHCCCCFFLLYSMLRRLKNFPTHNNNLNKKEEKKKKEWKKQNDTKWKRKEFKL